MMNEFVTDKTLFSHLQYFCMFIGYPYSGHSLVGSIIDAHPQAVISQELHVGRLLKRGFQKEKIFPMIVLNSIQSALNGRTWNNYSYSIPGEWNGRFTTIRVIGDKKGSKSTKMLSKRSEVVEMVETSFGFPVKYIHVMRNPYDIISTLYRKTKPGGPEKMQRLTNRIFGRMAGVEKLRQQIHPDNWLDVYHESIITDPEISIPALLRFFALEIPEGFIENCKKLLYKKPHQSRHDIDWKKEDIDEVAGKMSAFKQFSSYRFDT
jgi:hypothetical protein